MKKGISFKILKTLRGKLRRLYTGVFKERYEILKQKVEVNEKYASGCDVNNQENPDTDKTDKGAAEFSHPLPNPFLSETLQIPENHERKPYFQVLKFKTIQ